LPIHRASSFVIVRFDLFVGDVVSILQHVGAIPGTLLLLTVITVVAAENTAGVV
jgi:hypothetical protein